MRLAIKCIVLSLATMVLAACGSAEPPSSWNDLPVVHVQGANYRFATIRSEGNRRFTFGEMIQMMKKDKIESWEWEKDGTETYSLSTKGTGEGSTVTFDLKFTFKQVPMNQGTEHGVLITQIFSKGRKAPHAAIWLTIQAAAAKYIQEKGR